jgi:anti-sigma regulatory factor (Ser/Thr protein kinase)
METRKLIITNKTGQLAEVRSFLDQIAGLWILQDKLVFELNLILEEYISNLINYGYHDKIDHEIYIEITREETRLKLVVKDDAGPFNILESPENDDLDKPVEERKIGGLGIHFIRTFADQIEYESQEGNNILVVIKKFQE